MRQANTARVLKPARTAGPAEPEPIPPGHWIIASLRAGHPVAADCDQCVARRQTIAAATSREASQ